MAEIAPTLETTTALEAGEWDASWKGPFLDALSLMPNVSAASRTAGVGRRTVYDARVADEDFAKAWLEAIDVGVELLERIAHTRAAVGEPRKLTRRTVKTVDGKVVEETVVEEESVEVSNTLLIFLLKAHRPMMYRERVDHRITGADGQGPVRVEVYREPTRDRMVELAQLAVELELPSGVRVPAVIEAGEA